MSGSRARLALLAAAVLLALTDLWLAWFWQPGPPAHERPLPAPATAAGAAPSQPDSRPPGGDIAFLTTAGPRRLADYRGKIVVLYFGYTFCPDVCPTALLDLAAALNSLSSAEQAAVQPLFITLDPPRDTPAQLASYVGFFHPALVGGSPDAATLPEAAARYGIRFVSQATPGATAYAIDHSSTYSLIGRDGRLAAQLPHGTAPAVLAAAIRSQLTHH